MRPTPRPCERVAPPPRLPRVQTLPLEGDGQPGVHHWPARGVGHAVFPGAPRSPVRRAATRGCPPPATRGPGRCCSHLGPSPAGRPPPSVGRSWQKLDLTNADTWNCHVDGRWARCRRGTQAHRAFIGKADQRTWSRNRSSMPLVGGGVGAGLAFATACSISAAFSGSATRRASQAVGEPCLHPHTALPSVGAQGTVASIRVKRKGSTSRNLPRRGARNFRFRL